MNTMHEPRDRFTIFLHFSFLHIHMNDKIFHLIFLVSLDDYIFSDPSAFSSLDVLYLFSKSWNSHALEDKNVQKLINSTGLHFDVVILEEFFIDSFLMFGHKFKAPVVTICKFYCQHTTISVPALSLIILKILLIPRSFWGK